MRRPSTEQTEGDLNRLTTSTSIRSNESLSSTQTIIKTNINNDNNNNNSSNYLPNIIIANTEYQQCRKRKDRQDSISSLTQDRKLVRSNSEEHVPSCQGEVIRRVASHEDFKKKSPLKEHNEKNDESVGSEDLKSLHPVTEEIGNDQSSSGVTSAKTKLIDVPQSQVHRLLPSNESFDEHEYRRNSERFLKTKSPSGRKSPRKPRKSSPKYLERDENEHKSSRSNHQRHEKREQASPKDDEEEEMVTDSPLMTRSLYPWEHSDDKPVVCQRFAENTFDHVHQSNTKFIKRDHDLIKYISISDDNPVNEVADKKPYRNFMNAENVKTRDIMQKSHSPVGVYQTPDERIRQINKRLTSLKRKVTVYEETFEVNYGYRPSQADKTSDKHIKSYIAEIHRLRKEKSQIKADPISAMGYKNKFDDSLPSEKKLVKVKDTLVEIEKVNNCLLINAANALVCLAPFLKFIES